MNSVTSMSTLFIVNSNVIIQGVSLIKLLQVQFTSVAIVSEVENNGYGCTLHL